MPCHVDVGGIEVAAGAGTGDAASKNATVQGTFLPSTLQFDFIITLCDSQGSTVVIVSRLWAG
jgi:hypothetical protein